MPTHPTARPTDPKGKPYVLDAYGGRGLYSLASDEAKQASPIHQQTAADRIDAPRRTALPDGIQSARQTYDQHVYPGSPYWLAQAVKANPDLLSAPKRLKPRPANTMPNYHYKLPIGIHHRNAFEGIPATPPNAEASSLLTRRTSKNTKTLPSWLTFWLPQRKKGHKASTP